ncbi:Rrf2 family transcriptional regulator [Lacticaseibacillus saniviri]
MIFSKAVNMGLHVMTFMVQRDSGSNATLNELAQRFDVSTTYLSKIMTQLTKADLITSVPGVKGGYLLQKEAPAITFYDVISALQSTTDVTRSLQSDVPNCEIQTVLTAAQDSMWRTLNATKLSTLDKI